jgi:hypothetical protein
VIRAAAAVFRSGVFADPVARRQPQARAGQVVRADRTASYAVPRRQLMPPAGRDLRPFPWRQGISNKVRGGLPCHGDDLLPTTSQCRAGCSTAADGTAAVTGSWVIRHGCLVIAPSASHSSGTAPPHQRAGTGASRPRCEPRAAARAGPSSPPPLRSPGTRTPPACGSSGPHPCGCQSWPRLRFPGQPDAAQAQPGRTGVSVITFIGFPGVGRNADPGQRWSPYAAAPGQGPGKIANCPVLVALKMVLQIAARNIGQLTDIEPSPRHSPAPRRGPGRRRCNSPSCPSHPCGHPHLLRQEVANCRYWVTPVRPASPTP